MAELPRVINADYSDLPEALRTVLKDYYGPSTEPTFAGKLVLLGPNKDVEALQGTLTHERTQRATAVTEAQTLKQQLATLESENAQLKKDIAKLPKGKTEADSELMEKLTNLQASYDEQIKTLKQQIADERTARTTAESTMKLTKHEQALRDAAIKAGASETTAPDVVARLKSVIREKDGKFLPLKEDGSVILGRETNPTEPMSFEEVARGIISNAPHLKKGSVGGQAPGGATPTGAPNGRFVMTRSQAKNPQAYRQLREEAQKVGQSVEIVDDPVGASVQ